jgi:hypothetical protein
LLTRTRMLASASRTAVAGMVAAGILVLSLGVAAPSSGASGTYSASASAFCKTIIGFSSKAAAPKGTSLTDYKSWAKSIIPFYEKLASEAPNSASKKVLGELVTILKDYAGASSLSKLGAYEAANHAAFLKGTKALSKAIISCAKSF